MNGFRFAVQLSTAPSATAWRELATKVEDLGYSTLYVPDHFDDQLAPMVALTVAAEATTTLNVGTLVLDNDYRHPVVLAKEAATLDLMSEGRFELGLGAGWMTSDYESSGIPLDPPAVRVDRLSESLEVLEQLFSTGSATFSGEHYQVTNSVLTPAPFRQGGPKLVLGGGSRRVLTLAGAKADIVSVVPSLRSGTIGAEMAKGATPASYDDRMAWVASGAAGRSVAPELQCWTVFTSITDDAETLYEQFSALFDLPVDEVKASPVGVAGTVDEVVEQLEVRRDRWGFSYLVIHEGEIDEFAPVVAALAGR